jgi:hypothetical protein
VLFPGRQPHVVIGVQYHRSPRVRTPLIHLGARQIQRHFHTPVQQVHLNPRPLAHLVRTNAASVGFHVRQMPSPYQSTVLVQSIFASSHLHRVLFIQRICIRRQHPRRSPRVYTAASLLASQPRYLRELRELLEPLKSRVHVYKTRRAAASCQMPQMPSLPVMRPVTGAAALHVLLMCVSHARDAYAVFG